VGEIVLANRTRARALSLARRLRPIKIKVRGLASLTDFETLSEAAIVLNATSAGLGDSGFPALKYEAASKDCFFYDLIYARNPTPFLRPAIRLKRPIADGRGMLLHQGVLAFEMFNGCEAPIDAMRTALMRSLLSS
jgi:shikimate dehydrogenase